MKIYRAINYSENRDYSFYLFYRGVYNEALNLLNASSFSPSLSYLKHFTTYDSSYFTFILKREVYKFFYASIIDACKWVENDDFIILEIDLPLEEIKNYFGVGFYDDNRLEICLPYHKLYTLSNSKTNNIIEALDLFENKTYREYKDKLNQFKKIPNLTLEGANAIYPYLCFSLGISYKILKLDNNKEFMKWLEDDEFVRPNDLSRQLIKDLDLNQEFVEKEYLSFVEEENEIIKRQLKKMGHDFQTYLQK